MRHSNFRANDKEKQHLRRARAYGILEHMSREATCRLLLCSGGKLVLLCFILSTLFLAPAYSAATATPQSDTQPVQKVFHLNYVEEGFAHSVSVDMDEREVIFKAEPDFGDKGIIRGALPVGPGENDYIGFACDVGGMGSGTVYLDANRNLDLTDDEPVKLSFDMPTDRFPLNMFEGIHFETVVGELTVPYVFGMDVIGLWPGQPASCDVTIRSGWEGEIELHGTKWMMGVADNLDGVFDEKDFLGLKSPESTETPVDELRLAVVQNIMLDGNAYDLALALEPGEKTPVLAATFTEVHPPLGTLKLSGKFISRMVLKRDEEGAASGIVVLDSPAETAEVPVGEYAPVTVFLESGANKKEKKWFSATIERVVVGDGEPVPLKVGGPLNNTATVQRRGMSLVLSHELRGIGGELYAEPELDLAHLLSSPDFFDMAFLDKHATFAVYRNDRRIASGSFDYG